MNRVSKDHVIYAMSKDNQPVITVEAGSQVVFETCDCFEDQIKTANTHFSELDWNRINPATGPVFVKGAERGDILAVRIDKIDHNSQAVMVTGPNMGVIGDQLGENVVRIIPVQGGKAQFSKEIEVPLNPMIGVIGTAPAGEAISCGTPDLHGGNMDCKLIKEGSTLFLPVNVAGALFALGDLHAAMGDGEVAVCGAEIAGEVTVTLSVIKDKKWPLPMIETDTHVYTLASEVQLDDAASTATRNMVNLLEQESGISKHEAIALMSLVGNIQVCQVVDPKKTIRFEMPKSILSKLKVSL
ncbi:acetamidase/formamidase family protein [Aneurinibacillus sp. Ricciae_BoGa-3]|uniref:acetamidase/formamidase family protein n=1 Tax=Aneurinibacillus sp. Ricciae_BoGa-3 TaxID=3022697 RepID=UPI0023402D9B|nr:acetamidase/formamidase family protein [Aneurinibacillus sp. Ricciae_BoGa-3]WCK56543.1 acetamidase/formamidase family protein [Aneurinibacillus sp. Ricciae_BoGa-3]